jgi:hypothetical protein
MVWAEAIPSMMESALRTLAAQTRSAAGAALP